MMRHLTIAAACLLLASCGTTQLYLDTYVPEESGLNLVKVTDEASNSVIAGSTFAPNAYTYAGMTNMNAGISQAMGFGWHVNRLLDVSPDGRQLAYCTRMNKQDNVMVRSAGAQGVATQRTFRNIQSFSWGSDGNIYFSDMNGPNWYICSVNATAGSMMNQLTNGNVKDSDPMLSADGKRLFFTRIAGSGPSIWSLNRENGTLTSCSRGYSVCLIPDDPDAFYCVRNSTTGRSEIWYVNFVKGQESLIASDENRSFTNPRLSPDGKWLVCVGNSISNVTKKPNLDIFVVRTDGSRLTQLTFHPQTDTSPVWSADGRSIYFISSRANEDQAYNVWRMNFNLE